MAPSSCKFKSPVWEHFNFLVAILLCYVCRWKNIQNHITSICFGCEIQKTEPNRNKSEPCRQPCWGLPPWSPNTSQAQFTITFSFWIYFNSLFSHIFHTNALLPHNLIGYCPKLNGLQILYFTNVQNQSSLINLIRIYSRTKFNPFLSITLVTHMLT